MVQLWRKDLAKINPKAAESLADPGPYPNLFPNLDWALQAERLQARTRLGPQAFNPVSGTELPPCMMAAGCVCIACCLLRIGRSACCEPHEQALCCRPECLQTWSCRWGAPVNASWARRNYLVKR